MKRSAWLSLLLTVVLTAALAQAGARPAHARPRAADAYVLIQKINELRVSRGLAPYAINPILMQIAQAHSEYQASIGRTTHYSADGSRPFQRALAAGYPVAGDLTQGGWFSENTWAGVNLTEDQAIQNWLGDEPHTNTMLSPNLTEVGAGVAYAGNVVYYTVDAGRPATGGSVPAWTPGGGTTPGGGSTAPTAGRTPVVVNTPRPDGRTTHVVQPGETLWAIALAYGTTVNELLRLNGLAEGATIYAGQTLVVRGPYTATPVTPTPTLTRIPTQTPIPTRTATSTPLPSTPTLAIPTPTPHAAASSQFTMTSVLVILSLALLAAGVITWLSLRRPREEP